jgi:hypothetical protein
MPQSNYFTHGTKNEQYFHEDLIVEALHVYGNNFFYIPRTLIAKDEILGEDRLSKFKKAYQIEMYLENVDGFDGQGAFIQKFGLMMEQSATLVVARRRWQQLIGRFGDTIIPTRPCEGDLIYFPLTDGLFEIKFVSHQDPFYQIGKLFVYKLQVELFQYASEKLDTGVEEIDVFETLKSFDTDLLENGTVTKVEVLERGNGYLATPIIRFGIDWADGEEFFEGQEVCWLDKKYRVIDSGVLGSNPPIHNSGTLLNGTAQLKYTGLRATGTPIMGSGASAGQLMGITITNGGESYSEAPMVFVIAADNGTGALAEAYISSIDSPQSYGDNKKFKNEASDILFNEINPFGDFYEAPPVLFNASSTATRSDSTTITADRE